MLAVEYKKRPGKSDLAKATNQLRMYLTASVKFLQTIGITNFAVYGVKTDGPVVALPAAVIQDDDNIVHLFERLVESLDISTPSGAWHYAMILCRLAEIQAGNLGTKFEMVKQDLITSLHSKTKNREEWTIVHQRAMLQVDSKAKLP